MVAHGMRYYYWGKTVAGCINPAFRFGCFGIVKVTASGAKRIQRNKAFVIIRRKADSLYCLILLPNCFL